MKPIDTNRKQMTVLVLEDHGIVRKACCDLLAEAGFDVVWAGGNSDAAYRKFIELTPDVAVIDLSLGDTSGLEMIRRIKCHDPNAKTVVFSMHDDPTFASRALKLGAIGYVTKTSPPDLLVLAVSNAIEGKPFLSREIAQALALSELHGAGDPFAGLTDRELEVFQLLVDGNNSVQIASLLSMSPKSASNHIGKVKHKLGAKSIADLVRLSINSGIAKRNVTPRVVRDGE